MSDPWIRANNEATADMITFSMVTVLTLKTRSKLHILQLKGTLQQTGMHVTLTLQTYVATVTHTTHSQTLLLSSRLTTSGSVESTDLSAGSQYN